MANVNPYSFNLVLMVSLCTQTGWVQLLRLFPFRLFLGQTFSFPFPSFLFELSGYPLLFLNLLLSLSWHVVLLVDGGRVFINSICEIDVECLVMMG